MKLLLSDKEIIKAGRFNPNNMFSLEDRGAIAQAQLKHIFNLDMKTTLEVIVKLKAHLDKLFLKEMAK